MSEHDLARQKNVFDLNSLKRRHSEGRIWCISLMHNRLMCLLRRKTKKQHNYVTKNIKLEHMCKKTTCKDAVMQKQVRHHTYLHFFGLLPPSFPKTLIICY